ncbi:MAG: hypothetical protein CL850_02235 [Crocinitomicaceae bacterium]|nr:hypothetical protein [Crocinitomicaceae bacterium]|tara:strand:+ start:933 stop:2306 length:1374 start_codon:yes stop_codon:yes gene_type:complete
MLKLFNLNPLAFITCSILLGACSGSKNTVQTPSWVTDRPINPSYYVGIATVSKYEYPYNAIDIARENALNSLAREIRVQVSSSSVLSTMQVNNWVEENFASEITSTVAEDLEGYTLMGTYETEEEVWAYYRLSKSEYARILAERKRVALGRAYTYYLDAEKLKSEGKIITAFERYLMGLDAMSKYLAEENPYVGEDGVELKVDRALLNRLTGVISNIDIFCDISQIEVTLDDKFTKSVKVGVKFEGAKVSGVPLTYKYSRGRVPISGKTSTSGDGLANIVVNEFDPGLIHSELRVDLDIGELTSNLQTFSPLKSLVENLKATPLMVPIDLVPPKIRVIGNEKIFGDKMDTEVLVPTIKSELVENGVEVVETAGKGVITLYVDSDTNITGDIWGFFTSFLNATISLKDENGDIINHMTLDNVKGVQKTERLAANESYRKAKNDILDDFINEFMESIYK